MPPERIVRLPRVDNFWSVGGPGPCGPDSEMFYDWGEEVGCGRPECQPGCDCDRFLEFWNLVFMEFELHADGTLTPLPKQNIDTGLGLERGARILQQVESVYDTDGYQAIMAGSREQSGVALRRERPGDEGAPHPRRSRARDDVPRRRRRHAVERGPRLRHAPDHPARRAAGDADRARAAVPRRARRASSSSRCTTPIPSWTVPAPRSSGCSRPRRSASAETLARGLTLFEEVAADGEISGEDAFRLHDTYGFPLELTQELARERGLPVDEDDFRALMEEQRARSRRPVQRGRGARQRRRAQRVRRLRADRRADGDRRLRGPRRRPLPGEARASRRSTRTAAARSATPATSRTRRPARGPSSSRRRGSGDDQVLTFEGEGFARGRRASVPSCRGRCASRRWPTTRRRICCTRRCRRCSASTRARRAPRCGRTSCASTSRIRRRCRRRSARRSSDS